MKRILKVGNSLEVKQQSGTRNEVTLCVLFLLFHCNVSANETNETETKSKRPKLITAKTTHFFVGLFH